MESPWKKHTTIGFNLIAIAAAIGLWEIAAFIVHSRFFPGFLDVVRAFVDIAFFGDIQGYYLWQHAVASVIRVLAGFTIACFTGILLGLLMGLKPSTYNMSRSVVEPLRFIPPIAWIPLAFILLTGYSRYIFIIWLGAFFPILLNTIAAVKRTNPVLVDVAKTFGADKGETISKVVVPSALPEIVAGMRIGLGVGWMCIVAAEIIPLFGTDPIGLGRLIWDYTYLLRVDVIVAGMITIGLIGLAMNEISLQIEKRLFKWRREIKI